MRSSGLYPGLYEERNILSANVKLPFHSWLSTCHAMSKMITLKPLLHSRAVINQDSSFGNSRCIILSGELTFSLTQMTVTVSMYTDRLVAATNCPPFTPPGLLQRT